jgi:CheY-like chemotaxis protein
MTKRILVVEDQDTMAEIVAEILGAHGYQIDVAGNGLEALDRMAERRPDVILLDVSMPLLDGPATLKEIRARPEHADTPVVMMSALASSFPSSEGATRHQARLHKPFSDKQLLAAIASCVSEEAQAPAGIE